MGAALERSHVGESEYLAAEERAATRGEYIAGEVFAMAGGSERHNRITLNIAFHLRAGSRGHRCRAFMADMKLRVAAQRAFYYPDAMLVCEDREEVYPKAAEMRPGRFAIPYTGKMPEDTAIVLCERDPVRRVKLFRVWP